MTSDIEATTAFDHGPAGHESAGDAHTAVDELSHELARYGRLIHVLKAAMVSAAPDIIESGSIGVLVHLVKDGPMRQGDLAAMAALDPSTVSRHVSQLVQNGWVERRPHPEDGRAVQLAPTAAGEAVFEKVKQHRMVLMREVLADWSPVELMSLRHLMARLNDDIETHRPFLDLR